MDSAAQGSRQIVIRATEWDDAGAMALRDEQQRELRELYHGDVEPGVIPSASDVAIFLVAYDVLAGELTGAGIGCGGLRPLDALTAEIKRMYVRPSRRGSGLSRLILSALENQAHAAGWSELVLETGPLQSTAMRLYRSSGYECIPNFGHYAGSVNSVCFGKKITKDSFQIEPYPADSGRPEDAAEPGDFAR